MIRNWNYMGTISIFTKGRNFCDFLSACWLMQPFKMWATLKEKNLLVPEQILFLLEWTLVEKGSKNENSRYQGCFPWKCTNFNLTGQHCTALQIRMDNSETISIYQPQLQAIRALVRINNFCYGEYSCCDPSPCQDRETVLMKVHFRQ